jgi:DNA-binding MarR family transcriptional regulator
MAKYIRITEQIAGRLNAKEAYLFYCLSLNADFHTHESDVKQETLANEYGIKDTDQISDWLFQRCRYKLNAEHYVLISAHLHDEPISRQLKGFLILLKCKCLNGTNTTLYSQGQLANELKMAKSTVSNYISEAIDKAYIRKDKKGIHLLRNDIFFVAKALQPDFRKRKVKVEQPNKKIDLYID